MLRVLRQFLERFWVWLGAELPVTETDVARESGPGQFTYVVQPGDTLSGIARHFSTSVWILADLNDLDDPSLIRVGQPLLISQVGAVSAAPFSFRELELKAPLELEPGPFICIVKTGESLSGIARRFGVTVTAIAEVNHIQTSDHIRPGQRLLIPGPLLESKSSPPPRSKSSPP